MKFSYTINETHNNSTEKNFPNRSVRIDLSMSGEGVEESVVKIREFLQSITQDCDKTEQKV